MQEPAPRTSAAERTAAQGSPAPASAPAPATASAPRCPEGMAWIEGGTFHMGSDATDPRAEPDERPEHEVTLRPFCLDVTEVTVAQYRRCTQEVRHGVTCRPAPAGVAWMGADVRFWTRFCNGGRSDRDDHPINCVDWRAADTYCRWAGGALPTEAQWELAARGAEGRTYPWGDAPPDATRLNACGAECRAMARRLGRPWPALHEDDDGAEATAPVGLFRKGATPEGVLDLAGNVREWVQDRKADYDPAPAADPVQSKGMLRVLRGGSWHIADPRWLRGADRNSANEGDRHSGVGFRCARTPEPP